MSLDFIYLEKKKNKVMDTLKVWTGDSTRRKTIDQLTQLNLQLMCQIMVCFSYKVLIIMLVYGDSLNYTVLEQIWHKH